MSARPAPIVIRKGAPPISSATQSFKEIAVSAGKSALKDDITGRSAQLAYYFFLSLFPGLILVTALLGLLARHGPHLQDAMLHGVATVLPESAFGTIQGIFAQVTKSSGGGLFTFGALGALWSATAGMSAVQDTLNSVYRVEEGRPFWKRNLIAISLTIAVILVAIIALTVTLSGSVLLKIIVQHTGMGAAAVLVWHIASWVITLFLLCIIFALTYYLAPDVEQPSWQWITPGAAIGIVLWIAASLAFRLYLHYFDTYSKAYGSMGAVIVLLLWFYVSGLALLLGAEINSAYENWKAKQGDPSAKEKGEKVPG